MIHDGPDQTSEDVIINPLVWGLFGMILVGMFLFVLYGSYRQSVMLDRLCSLAEPILTSDDQEPRFAEWRKRDGAKIQEICSERNWT